MATTFQELFEQVSTIQSQAKALVGTTATLLRTLHPLAEAERGQQERKQPRIFGQKEE